MDTLKTQHNGIEITYNEKRNRWEFELRGHELSAATLALAKAAIDKPPPKDKPPFTRCKAYTEHTWSGDGFETVEVTSVAASQDWEPTQYWICNSRAQRQKISRNDLYPVNEKNSALIAKILTLDNDLERLRGEREALKKKLQEMPTQK